MDINNIHNLVTLNDHAFLLVLDYDSNPEEYINAIFTNIVNLKEKEKSIHLNRILDLLINRQYDDLIWINSKNNLLKKENIIEIKEKFSYPSNNVVDLKFYVIENIENSSKSSLNSLLKFLEEPTPNTYAIFTTTNRESLLNTIISRCKIIRLTKDNDTLKNIFNQFKLSEFQINIYTNIFYSISELREFLSRDNFNSIDGIIKILANSNDNLELYKSWEMFKNFDYYEILIILKAMFNLENDLVKKTEITNLIYDVKHNINKNLVFFKLLEIIK